MILWNIKILEWVFLMCHLPWKIYGLIHSQVVPVHVVRAVSTLAECAEICEVPLVHILAWISWQLLFGNSTWCWFHSTSGLTSILTPDNVIWWSVLGVMHNFGPHIWPRICRLPTRMWLVSTCASIWLVCVFKLHNLWVPVVVPVADWLGCLPVGSCTLPYKFHIIHIHCVLGSWGYIIVLFTLVGYQLEVWFTNIN